ncbi:uncharacterized protein FIESC28_05805 [Fusarium coffeatum]|uniref:Uncharacterized protein n=1 Tax=Fusarium coffeatum TaxID=231269 RepID=A0A366RP50_9HYPO|nr:uncharacterized protein FIESC28_05805 [Fusarium coffeatum]RBR18883.1 hypothetical protein FIESC28_05805 [Fusarium coffeatum]
MPRKKDKKMVEHASNSEQDYKQQGFSETPLSNKPSTCVFDPNGDTCIVLCTDIAQNFEWWADEICVIEDAPADEIQIDLDKVTFTNLSIEEPSVPDYQDDETDSGHREAGTSSDSTNLPGEDSHDQEICAPRPEKTEVCMLVSGKHLELASPIFKTMITGPFAEGQADPSGIRNITASDWDPEAFKIILTIIHGYHRDVPRLVSLEMLVKVAMIVDYYQCLESVEVYTDMWLEGLRSDFPKVYGRDCILFLFTSWALSKQADVLEEINVARQSSLAEAFSAMYELLDRLQEEDECSFECSSLLLGVLTKELKRRGILHPRLDPPFERFSIEGFKNMIDALRRPQWYGTNCYRYGCCIQNKLSEPFEKMESNLPTFSLQDFQVVKRPARV